MQSQGFDDLEKRASFAEHLDDMKRLEARGRIHREIEAMKAAGEVQELTAEEERMIRSFRRFRLRMRKHGEVFKWQTRMPEGVQLAEDTAEIVSPSEVGDVA